MHKDRDNSIKRFNNYSKLGSKTRQLYLGCTAIQIKF